MLSRLGWIALLCCPLAGCASSLDGEYGISEGSASRRSPAGMSLFRNMCEAEQRGTVMVRSLTPRAATKLKGLVWMPGSYYEHRKQTLEWIDRWLSSGDRTLVYIGRDYSPMSDYWEQIAEQKMESDSNQYLLASERSALERAELDRKHMMCREHSPLPWCLIAHPTASRPIEEISGPWADSIDSKSFNLYLRSHPVAWDNQLKTDIEAEIKKQKSNSPSIASTAPIATQPNPAKRRASWDWQSRDDIALDTLQAIDPVDLPQWTSMLTTQDDIPLLGMITARKWKNSRVVFVANASMTCNMALLHHDSRRIAKRIVDTLPQDMIGFISGIQDPNVRDGDDLEQQKGFEMLTVWPLNVITIHAVFFGALMLLAAFPIFGRAKRLPTKSTQDFGQHVEAVGSLLHRSRDSFYAKSTIADYFRIVRKEPTSPWAHIEGSQDLPTSPFGPKAEKPQ